MIGDWIGWFQGKKVLEPPLLSIMILGVDARPLAQNIYGGLTEYTRHLLPALLESNPQLELRLYFNAATQNLRQESWMNSPRVKIYISRLPNRFVFNPATRFLGRPKVNRKLGDIDLFFSPQPDLIGLDKEVPQVITVHDLAYCLFPNLFDRYRRQAERRQKLAYQFKRAQKIMAVSQATKQDLVDLFGVPASKITVIPLGLDPIFFKPQPAKAIKKVRAKYNLPKSFILFLGVLEARKNLACLVEAFDCLKSGAFSPLRKGGKDKSVSILPRRHSARSRPNSIKVDVRTTVGRDLSLVFAGPAGYNAEQVFEAARTSPYKRDIRFLGAVLSQDRAALYQAASVFVFPSIYEGFGLPALEAAACGVPVIISQNGALPEVLERTALYINPNRPQEIARALERVLGESSLQKSLVKAGQKRARHFSWQKTARQTYQLLAEV